MSENIYVGGTSREIIDAMLYALKFSGIEKLPGKGWTVTVGTEQSRTFNLLRDALWYRIEVGVPPQTPAVQPAPAGACKEGNTVREKVEAVIRRVAYDAAWPNRAAMVETGTDQILAMLSPAPVPPVVTDATQNALRHALTVAIAKAQFSGSPFGVHEIVDVVTAALRPDTREGSDA